MTILETIKPYLPKITLRAVSKHFVDKTYCDMAGYIYNDDMIQIVNSDVKDVFSTHVIYYKDADDLTFATLVNDTIEINYQMIKEDEYYKLVMKSFDNMENESYTLFDVDIMSKYNIMKSRGCEDNLKLFSKNKTLEFLSQTFKDYFNPDIMSDIVYLYIYLHSNLVLLNYSPNKPFKKFNMTKLPKKALLQEIYDMYNLLYVHLNLIEL